VVFLCINLILFIMNANKSFYRVLEGKYNNSEAEKAKIAQKLEAEGQSELAMTVNYNIDRVIALMRASDQLSIYDSATLDRIAVNRVGDKANRFRKLSPGIAFRPAPIPLYLQSASDSLDVGATANYAAPTGQSDAIRALQLVEGDLVGDVEAYPSEGIYIVEGGATNGIYTALNFLSKTVDSNEILVCGPGYFQFYERSDEFNVRALINEEVNRDNTGIVNFLPTVKEIEDAVSKKPAVIFITQPNNPTGELYNGTELQQIIQIAIDNGVTIVEDAAFEELVLPEFREEFVSVAKVAREMGALDRVITIKSFSKGKNMPGLRLGYIATTNQKMIDFMADNLLQQRDCPANVNGGLIMLDSYFRLGGVGVVDTTDFDLFEAAIKPTTKLIWIETPTNPLLKINDIARIAALARKYNVLLAVDSTFATPLNQSPLQLGADIVVYSTTKYISGHSDVIGGALTAKDKKLIDKLRWRRNALGLNPSPFDCWLIQRGLKTLKVRLDQQQFNAGILADWFEARGDVCKVYYPGAKSFTQKELVAWQMRDNGAMILVEFKYSSEQICEFLQRFKLWKLAESLGGVESMIDYPWLMTQSGLSVEERCESRISSGMVRFSVGIEAVEDLIVDVEEAFG